MSAGHSRHLVALNVRRQQEAELAAAEERERAETAAAAARASRLAAAELAAARAEVQAETAAAAARAAAAEADALRSNASSSVCADDSADADLELLAMDASRERAERWAAEHTYGGGAPRGAHGGGAPGGGAPDGRALEAQRLRERVTHLEAEMARDRRHGGLDGEHALHRRRDSLSPDRRQGHYGVQAVVRDGGWPTLTKTNYVEWAAIMRIKLQVRHLWEAVYYGDGDFDEDRR
ncbi:cilia- and flagella-associated protein 91-like [Panicum hallii]|uniref:cilia- and flagella-associated protein 91-like n=1 Tax=Panicum hallii TaxID=206008 RepID=UPI000DF4E6D4|nr:cilia- and flagella-associated protein 91-like [Panicum hallii]